MKKIVFILLIFCIVHIGQTQPTSANLGPNEKFFLLIREIWLQKNHRQLLPYFGQRTRISFVYENTAGIYFPEHATGILKKHFSEINIQKFEYIPEKMEANKGVAVYQYVVIRNGVFHRTHLYIHLNLIPGNRQEKCLIGAINEVNIYEKSK